MDMAEARYLVIEDTREQDPDRMKGRPDVEVLAFVTAELSGDTATVDMVTEDDPQLGAAYRLVLGMTVS